MEVSGGADRTEEEERMEGMDKELIRRLSTRDFAKGQRLAKERRWEAIQIKVRPLDTPGEAMTTRADRHWLAFAFDRRSKRGSTVSWPHVASM